MYALTILICTHNRVDLLRKVLGSLNSAERPSGWLIDVLVIANACSDGTHPYLDGYGSSPGETLPLRWLSEPTPGKSHALNRAIPELQSELVAFVDDDHRVDAGFLRAICAGAEKHPEATLFCGRILPDWDGSEPRWVHDTGPYRVYPLPVPKYDHGLESREFSLKGPVPGGGNLVLKKAVFDRAGGFSTDLGPRGHDLGGGEDTEFVLRALAAGERLRYLPDMVQYHYVDLERLRLGYLMRKGYQRSRASARARAGHAAVPAYMWRKLAEYALHSVFSLGWDKRRFYLIRLAAGLGELKGMRESIRTLNTDPPWLGLFLALACLGGVSAILVAAHAPLPDVFSVATLAATISGLGALALLVKSALDFSQTGPAMRREILYYYRFYTLYALLRLAAWAWLLMFLIALAAMGLYGLAADFLGYGPGGMAYLGAGLAGLLLVTAGVFMQHLLMRPSGLCASLHYLPSRLYGLWRLLNPSRLHGARTLAILVIMALVVASAGRMFMLGEWPQLALLGSALAFYLGLLGWALYEPEPATRKAGPSAGRPNILLIGSDTLRADRLGAAGYHRPLTPNIDAVARRGTQFAHCYVPCARTAPSLVSLFTGTWPSKHGIRDNFVSNQETRLGVEALPAILKQQGYRTAAISDWCGGDLAKFRFGFEHLDLPEDQWNLKFLLRQGPKDMRLFLSLFTHNRFGKAWLPELYYLAGVPLTRPKGRETRRAINALAATGEPFLLNVFLATTHPPFGSEYPYYTQYASSDYWGESKFAMARLTDPWEIIRSQAEPREAFDLDQILDLYDGCVKNFDDEVGRIVSHLEACGLRDNTIIVLYSDHGMEFFEHGAWGQGNSAVGDQSPRIPLVISSPGMRSGKVCKQVVRSIDIAPTLLDLVGLRRQAAMDGVSLRPALENPEAELDLPALNETGIWLADLPGTPAHHLRYPNLLELLEIPDKRAGTLSIKPEYQARIIAAKDRMIRRGRWKLVYQPLEDGHLFSLFDMDLDPGCDRNVIGAYPEVAERLWRELSDWLGKVVPPDQALTAPAESLSLARSGQPGMEEENEKSVQETPGRLATRQPGKFRSELIGVARRMDDWVYENLARTTRVLFVLTDGYGFSCQAPVIRALLAKKRVLVRTTLDRERAIDDVEFADAQERALFVSLYLPPERARLNKWHMVVDTHQNGFYPARNALRIYMHHGPGFGIMGNKTGIIRQSDIFCGLSDTEYQWFERLNPGIFNEKRLFVPVGFPKNDALYRGEYDRHAILDRFGLQDRKTILITSHWQQPSTLRRLGSQPFKRLAEGFPDFNIVQTGHPWLWQANKKVDEFWQRELLSGIRVVEARCPNARFIQTSDVESLLAVADLLVGDYSSVMTTYSLLDRPIVFFNDPEFEFTIPALKQVFVDASHSFNDVGTLVLACGEALGKPQEKLAGRARMRETFYANEGRSGEFMAGAISTIGRVCSKNTKAWNRIRVLHATGRILDA